MDSPGISPGSDSNETWEQSSQITKTGSESSRSDRDRRHSSSASSSTISANRDNSPGSNGRRTRPSVTSIASALPTVREMHDRRTSSQSSLTVPRLHHHSSVTSSLTSEETVVSSKKVLTNFQKVAARDPEIEAQRLRKLSRCNSEYLAQKLSTTGSWTGTILPIAAYKTSFSDSSSKVGAALIYRQRTN